MSRVFLSRTWELTGEWLEQQYSYSNIKGAEYFEGQLIDYDVCSNYGNWMYIAGVGNDPREDRYFNVVKQAHMYDAKAEYVTHWFPFLSKLPSPELKHRPFLLGNSEQAKYGINIGVNYPRPLVDVKYFKK